MGLQEALNAQKRNTPKCGVCLMLQTFPKDESKALADALEDRVMFSSAAIAKALRAEGHHISDSVLARHRRKECSTS